MNILRGRLNLGIDTMDPKAPRIATASLILGVIACSLSGISFFLNLGLSKGFGNEEIILLLIGSIFFLISFLASRQREEMKMIETLSVEEQFAAMESLPTKVNAAVTNTDQFGFEVHESAVNTDAIIASIVGSREEVNTVEIRSAMAALSTGVSGQYAADAVQNNPAPHAQTEQFREVFKSSSASQESFERIKVENIPLPGQAVVSSTPELPWQQSTHEFQTSGVAHVPLPPISQPQVQPQIIEEIPSMPNLDDLFTESDTESVASSSLPSLPNLDDLF